MDNPIKQTVNLLAYSFVLQSFLLPISKLYINHCAGEITCSQEYYQHNHNKEYPYLPTSKDTIAEAASPAIANGMSGETNWKVVAYDLPEQTKYFPKSKYVAEF